MGKQTWSIIYPAYLDQKKTLNEGRRISKEIAYSLPTIELIVEAMKEMKIEYEIEANKCYPKDFGTEGRIRYRYRNENGEKIKQEYQNSNLFLYFNHKSSFLNK